LRRLDPELEKAIRIRSRQREVPLVFRGVVDGELDAGVAGVDELDPGGRRVNSHTGGAWVLLGTLTWRRLGPRRRVRR
jgi:hypothetical protein